MDKDDQKIIMHDMKMVQQRKMTKSIKWIMKCHCPHFYESPWISYLFAALSWQSHTATRQKLTQNIFLLLLSCLNRGFLRFTLRHLNQSSRNQRNIRGVFYSFSVFSTKKENYFKPTTSIFPRKIPWTRYSDSGQN